MSTKLELIKKIVQKLGTDYEENFPLSHSTNFFSSTPLISVNSARNFSFLLPHPSALIPSQRTSGCTSKSEISGTKWMTIIIKERKTNTASDMGSV